jgi:hypothetical protein
VTCLVLSLSISGNYCPVLMFETYLFVDLVLPLISCSLRAFAAVGVL